MNGIVYDQGMIYLTNIQRMRYGYSWEESSVSSQKNTSFIGSWKEFCSCGEKLVF